MAIHPSRSADSADEGDRQDRVARPARPAERRRRGVAAVRLQLPRRWNRVGCLPRAVAAGWEGDAKATLWDFITTIGNYPTASDLATVRVPVVCSYGARSPDFMVRRTRSLAAAIPGASVRRIEGAAHAAPFDATTNFVEPIADTLRGNGA